MSGQVKTGKIRAGQDRTEKKLRQVRTYWNEEGNRTGQEGSGPQNI